MRNCPVAEAYYERAIRLPLLSCYRTELARVENRWLARLRAQDALRDLENQYPPQFWLSRIFCCSDIL
ncbi:hypothetical protein U5801_27910 [Lamprobacter modestohalophilus]|uniref:hypothetical protein n=1 Tax=Lamprobacter modestohalophilus TaxID=1064514 RepID=UPI002ADEC176|nr:hypothetical protein [Lamprobacter modestohalophilus]MEA1053602.1 hypothetical protein [Lamprobacter modestohalophilus]